MEAVKQVVGPEGPTLRRNLHIKGSEELVEVRKMDGQWLNDYEGREMGGSAHTALPMVERMSKRRGKKKQMVGPSGPILRCNLHEKVQADGQSATK